MVFYSGLLSKCQGYPKAERPHDAVGISEMLGDDLRDHYS